MNEVPMTQTPDGRWVPAQPLPFFADSRPWYVRLWHAAQFWRDEDELEKLMEPWWVPMEMPERFPRG